LKENLVPTLRILYWNIENFGAGANGKYTISGPEVMDLIAEVIVVNNIDVAGFNEIRSNLGATIAPAIATRCRGLTGGAVGRWGHSASPQFITGRLEQYAYVYDTNFVTFQNVRWRFPNPNYPPGPQYLGFPNQITSSRPPYAMEIQTVVGGNIRFYIAIFHGPEPGYWNAVRRGNNALADVQQFVGGGGTCVVMGDCNVKFNADASVANSYGDLAFTPFLNGIGFSQYPQPPDLTSLKAAAAAFPGMTIDDGYSQPYDQVFTRNDMNFNTVGNREELIGECMNPATPPYTGYLEAHLRAVENARTGAMPVAYATVEAAFVPFRKWVSDHIPVVAEVTY
jgi:hypothetical protein